MPDREKVKKGVWQCWLPSTEEEYETQCHDCPYYEPGITLEECMTALRTDVLALIKEQEAEAHLYTWEEYKNLPDETDCWMEIKNDNRVFAFSTHEGIFDDQTTLQNFMKEFRIWSKRPTKEQRMSVKWE